MEDLSTLGYTGMRCSSQKERHTHNHLCMLPCTSWISMSMSIHILWILGNFNFFYCTCIKLFYRKRKTNFIHSDHWFKKNLYQSENPFEKDNHSYGFCSSDKMKCLWSWDKNQHFWEWFYVFIMTLGLWNFFSSEKNLTNEIMPYLFDCFRYAFILSTTCRCWDVHY